MREFHTYALEWLPGEIRLYVDGALRERTTSHMVPDSPMFIFLSCYAMTNVTWQPEFTVGEEWPRRFEIDYLRVYQNPEWLPAPFGVGRTEVESGRLMAGYTRVPDPAASAGARVEVKGGRALAEFAFQGEPGRHDVAVAAGVPADTGCSYRLWRIDPQRRDYRVIASWSALDLKDTSSYVIRNVMLSPGVVLRLEGTAREDGAGRAFLDYFEVSKAAP